jgi:transketolase
VLSNGHASMLQYALLHLTGYDLPIGELKGFRQLHSKTPGHPEVDVTPGVETTTGPLGQGLTNAVGMALAEKLLAAEFNRPGHAIVDHHTYVFLGDGCLMEGISHEACALAGAWKLNKLVALYDDNGISIDGQVTPWYIDDVPARFKAYGWNVIGPVDGHDIEAVDRAIADASAAPRSRRSSSQDAHRQGLAQPRQHRQGARRAAGRDEIALTRSALGWEHEPFGCRRALRGWERAPRATAGVRVERGFAAYARHPELAPNSARRMKGELPQLPTGGSTPRAANARPRRRLGKASQSRWRPSPRPCPRCWAARPT